MQKSLSGVVPEPLPKGAASREEEKEKAQPIRNCLGRSGDASSHGALEVSKSRGHVVCSQVWIREDDHVIDHDAIKKCWLGSMLSLLPVYCAR